MQLLSLMLFWECNSVWAVFIFRNITVVVNAVVVADVIFVVVAMSSLLSYSEK